MIGHCLKVWGENLNLANTPKVVKAQGNMGGLVVRLVAIEDAESFNATTVTVKQGEDATAVETACGEFTSVQKADVKAGECVAEMILPWDVARYVTAELDGEGETTNARVTLGYLPR